MAKNGTKVKNKSCKKRAVLAAVSLQPKLRVELLVFPGRDVRRPHLLRSWRRIHPHLDCEKGEIMTRMMSYYIRWHAYSRKEFCWY